MYRQEYSPHLVTIKNHDVTDYNADQCEAFDRSIMGCHPEE
jgi:hypothetical protein